MKKTVADVRRMKEEKTRISMLTAYDAPMARMMHQCGVDVLLVGDSLGMVLLGYDSTLPVTMEDMLLHAKAVRRGAPEAFVVGDMPFGSYQSSIQDAIVNGCRFIKEAGCDAVKVEGAGAVSATVRAMVGAGIPVMGHLGLTPQTASQLGGFKVQGKSLAAARQLVAEAKELADAGVFSLVLECVPDILAEAVTNSVSCPTIGIGAGNKCDGQVLVIHDLLGMFDRFTPKFVKKYVDLAPAMREAVTRYVGEVRDGSFPSEEHSFSSTLSLKDIL